MSESVLNSGTESQYRLLLLLSLLPEGVYSSSWLSALDFIVIYGSAFDVSGSNLHGDSWMKFTEYATRNLIVDDGLRNLAFRHWALVSAGDEGFRYRISDEGRTAADQLKTRYAVEYRRAAANAVELYGDLSEMELDDVIHRASLNNPEQAEQYD